MLPNFRYVTLQTVYLRRISEAVQALVLTGVIAVAAQEERPDILQYSDPHGTAVASPQISTPAYDDRTIRIRSDDARNFSSALCRKAHSCYNASEVSSGQKVVIGCSCHDFCQLFGSCCHDKIDAPTTRRLQQLPKDSYVCTPRQLFSESVYMVTACPSAYANELVAGACSGEMDAKEPRADLLSTPLTDRETGITYRNRYCATCWDVATSKVSTWLWRYSCGNQNRSPGYDVLSNDGSLSDSPPPVDGDRYMAAIEYVRRACTLRYSPPPELKATLHGCVESLVDRCPDNVSADDPRRVGCTSGPTAYAYLSSFAYKNVDCAACAAANQPPNGATVRCQPRGEVARSFRLSFAVLLTPETDRCVATEGAPRSQADRVASQLCEGGGAAGFRGAIPASLDYRGACPPGFVRDDGVCRLVNQTQTCAFPESLNALAGIDVVKSQFVNDTLVAAMNETTALCFVCTVERHVNFSRTNGSLVVVTDGQSRRYDSPLFAMEDDVASVCVSLVASSSVAATSYGCSAVPDYVSAIALCLSEVCLVLFAAAYALLKYMRRFPGEMVLNQCVGFFLAFLLFLLRPLAGESLPICTVLAVSIHYLLLAAFAWTALYSSEIARALSFKVSRGPSLRRRVAYNVIGWGAPLACIALGLTADAHDLPFRPRYGGPQCFIESRFGNVTLFMAPLCVFLSVDVVVYGFMVAKLAIIARQTKMARSSHNEKLLLCVKLIFSMGLLWIVAVLASFTGSEVLYCIFSHLNALQGVFVFVVFVCKRDTLGSLRHRSSTHRSTLMSSSGTAQSTLLSKAVPPTS